MERQKWQIAIPQEALFRSSTGGRISPVRIRELCNGCQLVTSGDQCRILSPVSQADKTRLPKCDWRRP